MNVCEIRMCACVMDSQEKISIDSRVNTNFLPNSTFSPQKLILPRFFWIEPTLEGARGDGAF